MSMMTLLVVESTQDPLFLKCAEIRRIVFQVGQEVSREREVDGLDSHCIHFLADLDGRATGTARYRVKNDWAKVERVAVLNAARGTGLGRALMSAVEYHARGRGLKGVILASQEEAIPFYEKLHYKAVGEPFLDADIPHRDMKKLF